MPAQVLIELPARLEPVSAVRSTLIQSSLNTLRKRGHYDRYVRYLDRRHRTAVLETLAPEWLSMDIARSHYLACEALELPSEELYELGQLVGERIQGTFLSTLVRKARLVGLTPWALLDQFQRLWQRLFQGGAVGLTKLGPKDCMVDARGLDLFEGAYFRAGFSAVVISGIKLGAGTAVTVRLASSADFSTRCVFKCAWV